MAAVSDAPVPVEEDVLAEIAGDRGLQPGGLVDRLTQFQEHWEASEFLETHATPWGVTPQAWYLTVPTDRWESHARETETEAYEWLAVQDAYAAVFEAWSGETDDAHELMAAETPIIYARTEARAATTLSVPDPTTSDAVGTGEIPPLQRADPRSDSPFGDVGGRVDSSEGEGELEVASASVEWGMVFGLSSMGYQTHARGWVEISGPVGTVSVDRECYAHPATESSESETPEGSMRFEAEREHVEREQSLPADPVVVEFSEESASAEPDSLRSTRGIVVAHLDQFTDDYAALVETVPICQVCGEVTDPSAGRYVASVPAFGGGLCWECLGKAVDEAEDVRLTGRQAEAACLRQHGLSYAEIGDLMEIRASTAETHITRAAQRRREAMATYPVVAGIQGIGSASAKNE